MEWVGQSKAGGRDSDTNTWNSIQCLICNVVFTSGEQQCNIGFPISMHDNVHQCTRLKKVIASVELRL